MLRPAKRKVMNHTNTLKIYTLPKNDYTIEQIEDLFFNLNVKKKKDFKKYNLKNRSAAMSRYPPAQ
jgi:hypothetical protein